MDKRYQVFISSTFVDLKDERQAVLKAVLELDHMPSGMELFPASDDSAWQLIKDVIDGSDYYVLIIGGRYGSLDETGIGYTEKEYRYAVAQKKPVIALLHEDPNNLPRDKTETNESAWKKLKTFRSHVESKHTCVYWRSADDLKAKVIVGLTAAMKRYPTVGWVRANVVPSEATLAEILALRNRVSELEKESAARADHPPPGTEELAQGEDTFEMNIAFTARKEIAAYPYYEKDPYKATISLTWNSIFAAVAPSMINEASEITLRKALLGHFERQALVAFKDRKVFKEKTLEKFQFSPEDVETCKVQLRALGLIRESDRKRSVKDTGTYWTLTPFGNTLMVQLRAIRRVSAITKVSAGGETLSNKREAG